MRGEDQKKLPKKCDTWQDIHRVPPCKVRGKHPNPIVEWIHIRMCATAGTRGIANACCPRTTIKGFLLRLSTSSERSAEWLKIWIPHWLVALRK